MIDVSMRNWNRIGSDNHVTAWLKEQMMMPQAERRKRILITAFEPFDGRTKNASAEAVKALMQETIPANIEITVCLLPVETITAPEQVLRAINDRQPDYVVSLGEAKRDSVCIETVAYNERKFTIPDNAGFLLDGKIVPDAATSYVATLPVEAMLHAIARTGVQVRLSDDAGRYLCNEVMYSVLHDLTHRDQAPVPAGFIHVPHLPEVALDPDYPSMPTEQVVRALLAVLDVLASDTSAATAQTQGTSESQSG
jgi:pyroglutamyl-peptidase